MKSVNSVLLVNDTRGAQEYLQRAFLAMGIECDIALFGWPTINTIENSLNFDPLRSYGSIGKIPRPFINLYNLSKLKKYDVGSYVHRISFIDRPHFLRYRDLDSARQKFDVMSYTALGCDELSFIADNPDLPYKPCETCQKFDDRAGYCKNVVRPMFQQAAGHLNKYFDCVASTAVEYSHIETTFQHNSVRIPLPVDVSEVPWRPSGTALSGPVKIVHTPSRPGFKGTEVVLAAISALGEIRTDFEFRVISGLPFSEYITAIGEADIVIDQVWSQSPGMNALWLLCMGKIIFSGNTQAARDYFPFSGESPIIDAPPDATALAHKLSETISRRREFRTLADSGREYVSAHHGHTRIAEDYLRFWLTV